jgi:hypothetical protein
MLFAVDGRLAGFQASVAGGDHDEPPEAGLAESLGSTTGKPSTENLAQLRYRPLILQGQVPIIFSREIKISA